MDTSMTDGDLRTDYVELNVTIPHTDTTYGNSTKYCTENNTTTPLH